VAEQMFTVYAPIDCGMQSYFAPSMEAIKETLKEVEPTVFFGVPRIYEKIYEVINSEFKKRGRAVRKFMGLISNVANDYHRATYLGGRPSFFNGFIYEWAAKKFLLSVKKKIGLANARICVCGAAPVSKDILWFFSGLDIPVYEVYGQSENCGPAAFNLPGQAKIGSVGRALLGSEIKIAEDGEILLKGPHVFLGYYKDESATNEVLKNDWLYTGDIGLLDKDGYLSITDRKKDLLITAGGKNISPQNLETMLKHLPYIQSAVVIGDAKKFLCALLSPDMEKIRRKALDMGKSPDDAIHLLHEPAIHREIEKELAVINRRLAPVEQIKRYSLLPNEFSVDSGEFTPTMKVKRKFVNKKYQSIIDKMYNENVN
jgi:long-chain acyl-CoA synthetase